MSHPHIKDLTDTDKSQSSLTEVPAAVMASGVSQFLSLQSLAMLQVASTQMRLNVTREKAHEPYWQACFEAAFGQGQVPPAGLSYRHAFIDRLRIFLTGLLPQMTESRLQQYFKTLPEVLLENTYFLRELVRVRGELLPYLPDNLKHRIDIVRLAVKSHGPSLFSVISELRYNPACVTDALKNSPTLVYKGLDLKERLNLDYIRIAVSRDGLLLKDIVNMLDRISRTIAGFEAALSDNVKPDNADVLQEKLAYYRKHMGEINEHYREIVLLAVKDNPLAMQFADMSLRNDKAYMLEAMKYNVHVFDYAGPEIEDDKELTTIWRTFFEDNSTDYLRMSDDRKAVFHARREQACQAVLDRMTAEADCQEDALPALTLS